MDPIKYIDVYHAALLNTCTSSEFLESTTIGKTNILLRLISQHIDAARVSAWGYNRKRTKIICHCLYESTTDQFSSGMALSMDDYPEYFRAMSSNRVVVANNAREHSATKEFTESYLVPLGIYSMLDTPIYSSDGQHGILCVEDTKADREWSIDEISFVIAVADKISLALEHDAWLKESEKARAAQRTDPLTGLENRIAFQERLNDSITKSSLNSVDAAKALIVIGIDRFSSVNDEIGYNKANEVLRSVALQLTELTCPEKTFPARLSGDHFAVWIPELSHDLALLIQQVQKIFQNHSYSVHGYEVDLTASIGAIEISGNSHSAEHLVRKAEIALSKAKEHGVGSYAVFDEAWISNYNQRNDAKFELMTALNEGQIIPYYQPILDTQTGKVAGLEALIRWNHPSRGILSPYFILPLATDMRIMPQLGELMFQRVFQDIAKHPQLKSLSWISINVSSEQLNSNTLLDTVSTLFEKYRVDSSMIELEIVEELISHDSKLITDQFEALGELGIRFSIDDFGTGYSSLARLKHLPVSKLKIDRSFVDGLPGDESDCCIASSIIGMAKGLNLELVAEGVETQEQAQWLKDHNCSYIQGYLHAKPMSLEALLEFLNSPNS